jgi:ankyrin repeat protein
MASSNQEERKYRPSMIHPKLLLCAKALGYSLDMQGVCFGFTMRWIEAVLTDTTYVFFQRLQKMDKILESIHQGAGGLALPRDIDIEAFFDSVLLYQFVEISSKILEKPLSQQHIGLLSEIASSNDMIKKGGLTQSKPIFYGEFSPTIIKSFLEELQGKLQASGFKGQIPLLLTLFSINETFHATTIIYEERGWHFMDVNFFRPKIVASIDELIKQLPFSRYIFFDMKVILPKQDIATIEKTILKISPLQLNLSNSVYLLYMAIINGDLEVVNALLAKGVSPNATMKDGVTPLYYAAHEGHFEIVKALLEKGADPAQVTPNGATPLFIAAQKGFVEIVKTLLEKGAIPSQVGSNSLDMLCWAIRNNHIEVVRLLLEKGLNPNQMTDKGNTSLGIAVYEGNIEIVKTLLDKGADPNQAISGDFSLVYIAVARGHWEVVKLLVEKGANPNQVINTSGATLLNMAAKKGQWEVFQALVEQGANFLGLKRTPETNYKFAQENPKTVYESSSKRSKRGG